MQGMNKTKYSRQFILRFFNEISGAKKTEELISAFTSDPKLIEQLLFFEKLIPQYEMIADEITTEGDRVIVKARARGKHQGEVEGISPTFKTIEIPFAVGYRLEPQKIIDHWLITDQMVLLEQLGLTKPVEQ